MSQTCFRISIRGRVQGVGFRYHTRIEAMRLGLRGWVRNCADGSVEACICGPEDAVAAMLEWLMHGPDWARVDELNKSPEAPPDNNDFAIR
ncbi:MAG: acylphosphatase [Mariprofundaceae bacterium]